MKTLFRTRSCIYPYLFIYLFYIFHLPNLQMNEYECMLWEMSDIEFQALAVASLHLTQPLTPSISLSPMPTRTFWSLAPLNTTSEPWTKTGMDHDQLRTRVAPSHHLQSSHKQLQDYKSPFSCTFFFSSKDSLTLPSNYQRKRKPGVVVQGMGLLHSRPANTHLSQGILDGDRDGI